MESPLISKIRFLDRAGNAIGIPLEWSGAQIEVLVPSEDWSKTTLSLQRRDLPLRLAKAPDRIYMVAEWPQSNPGNYRLDLNYPGGCEQRIVTITPRKISENSFARMLSDLEAAFPAAVAIALQRLGAFAGIDILPPDQTTLAQEVTRLHRAIDGTTTRAGLAAVLEDISKRPHQILQVYEPWVKVSQARRPHPARIKDAICRGYNFSPDNRPTSVLDTRVEHTFDVYENRLVRFFLHQVDLRLRIVTRAVLNAAPESQLLESIHSLTTRLARAKRQAAFLNSVSLLTDLPTCTTMVLLNTPAYRSAFQGYLEFRRSYTVRIDEPRLDSPLENVPALYQLWGTMAVIQVLLECAAEAGYRVKKHSLMRRDEGGLCFRVLPDGEPVVILVHPESEMVVKLIPERTYKKAGVLRSITFQQRPDIALEIESPNTKTRILLFDPKYKLRSEDSGVPSDEEDETSPPGVPKKVDIDKMHAYRDAIRGSGLERAVSYAAILYPGSEIRYADDIEALHAYPGESEKLTSRLREVIDLAIHKPVP